MIYCEKTALPKKFTIEVKSKLIAFFDFPEIFGVDKWLYLIYYSSNSVFIMAEINMD